MGISFRHRGDFKKTERFLKKAEKADLWTRLEKYGQEGVNALSSATPKDTGLTAGSWNYEIHKSADDCAIYWTNSNDANGWFNVAIGLQYGHGTGTGGWVEGIDYINPAIQPIFEKIAEDIWSTIERW